MNATLTRRSIVTGSTALLGLSLAGCTTAAPEPEPPELQIEPTYLSMYGPRPQEKFPVPAVNLKKVNPQFFRKQVSYETKERPGTIVVDTSEFYFYHIQENGMAMRYGVGLGKAGFEWSGSARIAWKRSWPTWTPPDDMIERQPELAQWSSDNGGMPPGIGNPLGARALYIFQGNVDTLYRLHGTQEEWSIGRAVSSGCVRLLNQDVIDLYSRVQSGSKILVV